LTGEQLAAVKSLYDGPRNPRTGEQIFSGWPRGSESAGPSATQGPGLRQIIDLPQPRRSEFWNAFVFHDPNWHWSTFDFDRDLAYANAAVGYVSAIEHDLTAFKRSGGKLLSYAGWVDPILPGGDVVHYYEQVVQAMGGLDATKEFSRLFMMPGVGHCAGGPGPDTIDPVSAIRNWVEKGVAPETLVASKRVNGKTVRTRPLCAYPHIAAWSGTGSIDDAANFSCRLP
jgi:feruloyl esterase